jgi:biopolymer transport protein ExbD
MKSFRAPPRKKARIEIIPLIDVIFFLLATFVLVSLSMTKLPGVRVRLPESETSQPHELAETVTISITDKGGLYWNKEALTFDQFLLRLVRYQQGALQAGHEARILLNADTRASYGACVTILDEIRKAGIVKVSIETEVKRAATSG